MLGIKETCIGLKRMSVLAREFLQTGRRLRFEHARIMQQVEINLFSPGFRPYRTVGNEDDITTHHIFAIRGPDMRMKCILDHDVVLNNAKKSLSKLDTTAQTEIFNNMKIT